MKLLSQESTLARLPPDPPIVIDNGSAYIKAGCSDIASLDRVSQIPSLIGDPKYPWYPFIFSFFSFSLYLSL
jgi:hypothetical protein